MNTHVGVSDLHTEEIVKICWVFDGEAVSKFREQLRYLIVIVTSDNDIADVD